MCIQYGRTRNLVHKLTTFKNKLYLKMYSTSSTWKLTNQTERQQLNHRKNPPLIKEVRLSGKSGKITNSLEDTDLITVNPRRQCR